MPGLESGRMSLAMSARTNAVRVPSDAKLSWNWSMSRTVHTGAAAWADARLKAKANALIRGCSRMTALLRSAGELLCTTALCYSTRLLQQYHLLRTSEFSRDEAIEIHAARNLLSARVTTVPLYIVGAGHSRAAHKLPHQRACYVVNLQAHRASFLE